VVVVVDEDCDSTFDILSMIFLRFCVDMVVVMVWFWCYPLVFCCVVCSKDGVVQRNYFPPGGAVGPDQ
jgi:hypothetical protein